MSEQFKVNVDPKVVDLREYRACRLRRHPRWDRRSNCYISEWVQNGHAQLNQGARVLSGTGYSELTFKLDVNTDLSRQGQRGRRGLLIGSCLHYYCTGSLAQTSMDSLRGVAPIC